MNKQRQQLFGMMLLAIMSFMPLTTMAEYYVSEVTLSPGQQTKVYLPDMYVEAMTRYGSGYPYTWSSDNSNVCTATTYRSRTYCNIYAKSVGTTKIHYHGEYYRNGVIYDYDCYWDVKVISSGGEGDDTGVDTPTGDPNEPADKWGVSGNYDIKWYDKNQSTFEIATNRELAGLAYLVNNGYSDFKGKTIKITEDISLSGKSWSSIGTYEKQFNGTFDGQGHVLGGLYIGRQNENQEYFGFFGYLGNNSVVRNVTLQGEISIVNPIYTDTKYSGTHYVGGLAGDCKSTNIEKCKCEMIVKYSRNVPNGGNVKNVYIGGMFGYFSGEGVISYCSHEGDVSCIQTPSDAGYSDVASAYVGGLIGNYSGDSWGGAVLEYCENVSTTISCEVPTNRKAGSWTNVGGLFAKGYGKVEHCRNICNFDIKHHGFAYSSSSISVSIGGIGGESTATTIDCYSSVQKAVVTSSRLDNVYYSGIGGNSNTSKANFSNSDVSIQTSRPLSRKYDGSTAFTSAQMQTPAFLEELNMYSILEGDGAVWTQDDGGFPYFAKFHEEPDVIVTSIILNKSSLSLQTGQTETLTATVKPDNATDKTVTWSSSNANIATVDSEGKITAVATGEATITCTANDDSGVSATCEVTVKTVPQSITIPSTMTVVSGQTVTLTPTITPANAVTTLTWSSDDESIATVSSEGVVTGVKAGQTVINVATDNGKTAHCTLTVVEPNVMVTSITLNQSAVLMKEGNSLYLSATIKPDNATDKTVTWLSSNTNVATVDSEGKVTAVAAGETTITCTASDGSAVKAICVVTVKAVVKSIELPTTMSVVVGQTVTLTPTITPADAETSLTWSSDDENIATVNSDGVVTGVKAGQTVIKVETDNGLKAYCKLTVTEPEVKVTDIILDVPTMNLVEGKSQTIGVTVKPDNATDKSVTWSSDNTSVATVDNSGKVTAVAAGNTTITCTASDGSGVSASCEVTVQAVPVSITIPTPITIVAGQTVTLTPTITPANAVTTLTWSSDDESIATVSSEGVVTGVKAGQTFINVTTDNGKTAYCKLTVTEPTVKVTDIILDVSTLNLEEGKSQTLGVTVKPDNATDKTVTWSSNNTSVATVDSEGKVTAIAAGTAIITCSANDGSGVQATCEVTVKAVVKSIELPTTMTVAAGQTVTLTPTITPVDAETALTWSSDDETIATVNSEGVVTGVKKGQTFINVETDNGKTAYCKLTVTPGEPVSITLPKSTTLHVGETVTLTPTITPADAETMLIWKSDDETIVRVSTNGVLTGVAEGLALVTVSTSNGLTSNACKVKVEPDLSGISDVQTTNKANTVYTLSGQRLAAPKKGVNIVGGRKVVVK